MCIKASYRYNKIRMSIVFIEGSQFISKKNIVFLLMKIGFVLANIAHPDESSQCLPKYLFGGLRSVKVI